MSGGKNGLATSGTISATFPCRPVLSARALRLGTYPSCLATAVIRWTVSGLSSSGRLKARDTLDRFTPAAAATWLIVSVFGFCESMASPDTPNRIAAPEVMREPRA